MHIPDFEIHKATSLHDASRLLAEHGPDARLLKGHFGIFGAGSQQRRRLLPRHILDRHVRVILLRFGVRVPSGHFLGPESSLPTELIERAAVAFAVF